MWLCFLCVAFLVYLQEACYFDLFLVFDYVFKPLPLVLSKYMTMVVFTCRMIMANFTRIERVADTFISWYLSFVILWIQGCFAHPLISVCYLYRAPFYCGSKVTLIVYLWFPDTKVWADTNIGYNHYTETWMRQMLGYVKRITCHYGFFTVYGREKGIM